jgi:hypothetical protein
VKGARDRLDAARKELDQLSKPLPTPGGKGFGGFTPQQTAGRLKEGAQAQQQLVERTQDYVVGDRARERVSDANRTG